MMGAGRAWWLGSPSALNPLWAVSEKSDKPSQRAGGDLRNASAKQISISKSAGAVDLQKIGSWSPHPLEDLSSLMRASLVKHRAKAYRNTAEAARGIETAKGLRQDLSAGPTQSSQRAEGAP